jgi:hypothetical protein
MKFVSKLTIFIALATFSLAAQAQKIKVKKADVFVDGQLFLQMPFRSGTYRVCLPGENGPLFVAQFESYSHPGKRDRANPQGTVHYVSIRFGGIDQFAEIGSASRKRLTQLILDFELIRDGELDNEKVRAFIAMTGTAFSNEKNRIQIIDTY